MKPRGQKIKQFLMGFFLSPLVALLFGSLCFQFAHPEGFGWLDHRIARLEMYVLFIYLHIPTAYFSALAVGSPICITLMKLKAKKVWWYAPFGAATGSIGAACWYNLMMYLKNNSPETPLRFRLLPFGIIIPALSGVVGIVVFWRIAVWKTFQNPRDAN